MGTGGSGAPETTGAGVGGAPLTVMRDSARVRYENTVSTSAAHAAWRIVGRLPAVWRQTRAARRLAPSLPRLGVDLRLPDGEALYRWIEDACQWPHRRPGSQHGLAAEGWLAERMGALGLDDVRLDPIPIDHWRPSAWSLEVEGESVPSCFTVYTGFTGPDGVQAPLVWVGTGAAGELDRADVRGKIAVADVEMPPFPTGALTRGLRGCYHLSDPAGELSARDWQVLPFVRRNFIGGTDRACAAPACDVYWQAHRRGARGILLVLRDQPGGTSTHYGPYDGLLKPMPALWIGKGERERLRGAALRGASARLLLDGRVEPGVTHNVWGSLPGASEETILVTTHHDSPFQGAVEDGAGIAQLLAQVAAWSRVPRAERPRSLVFVATAGHFYGSTGAHTFARTHADLMERARVLITLEHLAAREVRERGEGYEPTGRLAFSALFTQPEDRIVASVIAALRAAPTKMTASLPSDLLGPAPPSDALGFVLESSVPVISWIGCPYYLLDDHDTLDKIDRAELPSFARAVAELIRIHMLLE